MQVITRMNLEDADSSFIVGVVIGSIIVLLCLYHVYFFFKSLCKFDNTLKKKIEVELDSVVVSTSSDVENERVSESNTNSSIVSSVRTYRNEVMV